MGQIKDGVIDAEERVRLMKEGRSGQFQKDYDFLCSHLETKQYASDVQARQMTSHMNLIATELGNGDIWFVENRYCLRIG